MSVRRVGGGVLRHLGKLLTGAVMWLALILGPPALVAWAVWVSLNPDEPGWEWAAGVGAGAVISAGISARRAASDLSPDTTTTVKAIGSGLATSGATIVGAKSPLSTMAIRNGLRSSTDLADKLSAGLTALLAVAATGLAPEWGWAYAVGLGALAAWTVARRAGAWRHVDLHPRMLNNANLTLTGVAGLAAAAGWYAAGWKLHGTGEWEPSLAAGLIFAGLEAGVTATTAHLVSERERMRLAGPIAKAIGISDGALADLRWRIDGEQIVIQGPLPAAAITTEGKLETGLAAWLPEYRVMEAGSSRIVLGPVSDDVSEARAIATDTDGLVLTAENDPPYAVPSGIPVLTLEDLR